MKTDRIARNLSDRYSRDWKPVTWVMVRGCWCY